MKKIAVCVYHHGEDEKQISKYLGSQYCLNPVDGYILTAMMGEIWDIKKPYFTHGVMQATYVGKKTMESSQIVDEETE